MEWKRFQVVDFTSPVYVLNSKLSAPYPKRIPPFMNILKPFSMTVWISILMTLIIVIIVNVSLEFRFWHKDRNDKVMAGFHIFQSVFGDRKFQFGKDVKESIMNLYYVLLPDIGHYNMPNLSMACWFTFVFLILTSYNCNLRAYLMAIDYEAPIENEEDVINQGRVLNLPRGSPNIDLFKDSPVEVHQAIYQVVKVYNHSEREQQRIFEENGVVMTTAEKHGSHDHADDNPFRVGKKVIRLRLKKM